MRWLISTMLWLSAVFFLLGLILLWTPFWVAGIFIVIVTYFVFTSLSEADERASEKEREEEREKQRKITQSKKQIFEKAIQNNPFNSETEDAYNNLSYGSRPSLGVGLDETRDYKDVLRFWLKEFEEAYIDRGEEAFRVFSFNKTYVYEKPALYDQICDYVGQLKLPELSEDLKYALEAQQLYHQAKETKFDERKNFLIHRIQQLEKDGEARRVIQSKIVHEFKETFNDEISVKRINGIWFANGLCLGGQIELQ